MNIQTKDPVLAVLIERSNTHEAKLEDHEGRIRPLESFKAQVLALAFLGSVVGGSVVGVLVKLLGGGE